MSKMLAVRFQPDVIAAVRRFARQDGVTVSRWLRNLVAAELKHPNRQPPVDVSLYPQTQTIASGASCRVEIEMSAAAPTG